MKEVFSKNFWEDVKKTFDEAREGPPADKVVRNPAEIDSGDTSTSESPAIGGADAASVKSAGEARRPNLSFESGGPLPLC